MREWRDFGERFDHNLHALRIVESFEQRYARFPGLNLTFEVREGIVKHSRDFAPGEVPELDPYLPGLRPPLEAQLIDLADEIAYNTADLDDAYSAGLITADDAAAAVPLYREIREAVETQFPGATPREQFHEVSAPTGGLAGLRPDPGHRKAGGAEAGVQAVSRTCARFPSRLAASRPKRRAPASS